MKIVSIYISFLQMNRAFQIMGILIKHSFGELFAHTRFGKRRRKVHKIVHTTPERIRMTIEDLGPTFVKFGQILADRPDMVSEKFRIELKKLQSRAVPFDSEYAIALIEKELNAPLEQVFSEFDRLPLAAASIGQVYQGRLLSGDEVVVKIQRPFVENKIKLDIYLLKYLSKRFAKQYPELAAMNITGLIDEFSATILKELDYTIEASNINRFRIMFKDNPSVHIPVVHTQHCTKKLLVMEKIHGIPPDDLGALQAAGLDLSQIARNGADALLTMILKHGFFHADPHPGNICIRDGKIVWLDMGMMGTLTERERKLVGQAVSGVARGDVGLCRDAVLGLGEFRGKTDKRQLYRDIEGLLDQYGTADLGSMDLAKVFEDLTDVMKRNGISMPSSLTMLARGLATIEGVVADLSPEINVMNVVTARMGSQLLHSIDWRGEIVRDAQAVYASAHKSLEIPSLMADILRTGLKGEANLGVEHHVGNDMARLMQDVVLKLCAALVAAALLVCGALLRDVAPLAGGLSWLTVFCFLLSAALLGWAFVWKDQKK